MTDRAWTDEDLRWARECLDAGDSLRDIAAWSGRTFDDVKATLAPKANALQASKARLITRGLLAGELQVDVARRVGVSKQRVNVVAAALREAGHAIAVNPGRRRRLQPMQQVSA